MAEAAPAAKDRDTMGIRSSLPMLADDPRSVTPYYYSGFCQTQRVNDFLEQTDQTALCQFIYESIGVSADRNVLLQVEILTKIR